MCEMMGVERMMGLIYVLCRALTALDTKWDT